MFLTARILVILLALILLVLFVGCGEQKQATTQIKESETTVEDVTNDANELVEVTKAYTLEQRKVYEQQLAQTIEEYSQEISALKNQMIILKGEAKAEMQQTLDTLHTNLNNMKSEVQQMKTASDSAWEELKEGLEKAEKDLSEGFSNALQSFKQEKTLNK